MALRTSDLPRVERLFYTPVEVAAMLAIARTTTYDLIKQGEIPSIRVGNRVRIPRDAFDQWLEEKTADIRDRQRYGSKARVG